MAVWRTARSSRRQGASASRTRGAAPGKPRANLRPQRVDLALARVPALAQVGEVGGDGGPPVRARPGVGAARGRKILLDGALVDAEVPGDRADAQPLAVQRVDLGVAGLPPRVAPLALPRGPRRRRRLGWTIRRGAAAGIGGRRRRRGGQCHRGQAHLAERGVVSCQQALEHVAQVGEQVPAVGHLHGVRRALPRSIGIGPAPIAADDLGTRVRLQPRCQARGRPIGEQVDRAVPLQVDQDRAVCAPFLQAPVVHAQDARRADIRQRGGANRPP